MLQPVYEYTAPDIFTAWDIVGSTRDAVREEYLTNRTGPWTAPMVITVAFPALEWIRDDIPRFLAGIASITNHLPPTYDATLRAGYTAQQLELTALLARQDVAVLKIMSTSWGQLAVSAMHPLSRGTVRTPTTASVFSPPAIDPRFCSHGFDCAALLLGLELDDRLILTPPMAALDAAMRTEFHASGTTAMMPRGLGGVVDTALRVYGTRGLRVVDAGIIPLVPGAHIQAAAADIIKLENVGAWGGTPSSPKRPRPRPPHTIRYW
ncbi:GMC oxidoreductase-domain-containing protein [Biscogniauxia marginata]|nr:GMC oxidoreductase-domain-containing protein [Biscogniauxia marginata]